MRQLTINISRINSTKIAWAEQRIDTGLREHRIVKVTISNSVHTQCSI
jgi:hypothetical protein